MGRGGVDAGFAIENANIQEAEYFICMRPVLPFQSLPVCTSGRKLWILCRVRWLWMQLTDCTLEMGPLCLYWVSFLFYVFIFLYQVYGIFRVVLTAMCFMASCMNKTYANSWKKALGLKSQHWINMVFVRRGKCSSIFVILESIKSNLYPISLWNIDVYHILRYWGPRLQDWAVHVHTAYSMQAQEFS